MSVALLRDDSGIASQCFLGNITAERDGYNGIAEVISESFLSSKVNVCLPGLLAADPEDAIYMFWVIVIVTLGLLFLQAMALAKFYRKAPPGHAMVRVGHGGQRVAVGSGMVVVPILHLLYMLSLAPSRIDFTDTCLDSEWARIRQLPKVFQVAIGSEPEMIATAARRLLALDSPDAFSVLVKDIMFDQYERLLAQEDQEGTGDSPANRFVEGVEEGLNEVGLTIVACHCQ